MTEPDLNHSDAVHAGHPSGGLDVHEPMYVKYVEIDLSNYVEFGSTGSSAVSTALVLGTFTATGDVLPSFGSRIEAEWRQLLRRSDPAYEPSRTPLGAKLRRWRARFIESGGRLLTSEEIAQEVARRRGGVESEA